MLAGERAQLRVVRDELVQPVLDVEAGADRLREQSAPGGREAAALRRDADERGVRLVREPIGDVPTTGMPLCVSPGRSESTIATTGSSP